jgi:hypothetical protein
MVENTVAFFYPDDPASTARAPHEVTLANMRWSASLTLRILKFLYPRADLDASGEGFMVTYTEEEATKLVEDSTVTVNQIVEMLPVNMS